MSDTGDTVGLFSNYGPQVNCLPRFPLKAKMQPVLARNLIFISSKG